MEFRRSNRSEPLGAIDMPLMCLQQLSILMFNPCSTAVRGKTYLCGMQGTRPSYSTATAFCGGEATLLKGHVSAHPSAKTHS